MCLLISLCLFFALVACSNNDLDNIWPVHWFSYQGIVAGETSMKEVKQLLGEPLSQSYDEIRPDDENGVTKLDYDGFSVFIIKDKVQMIALDSESAMGIGDKIKIGSSLEEVLSHIPSEPKIAQIPVNTSTIVDFEEKIQDYGCYLIESVNERTVVSKGMLLRLGKGREIDMAFDQNDTVEEICIRKMKDR